ncbi:MAG TPA: hypothetical protein VEB21_20185 [Terriglobales bacterium]|nr:hypothetical protein [Terriglobales bacterium]
MKYYLSTANRTAVAVGAALWLCSSATSAQAADPLLKCRAAIAKGTAEYERSVRRCHAGCLGLRRCLRSHCGNGVTNFAFGETCDDGNVADGDACPSDCRVSPCSLAEAASTALVDVSFAAPKGTRVSGMTLFLHYPEEAGVVPDTGNVGSGAGTPITDVRSGVSITSNDVDYGVRAMILDDSLAAIAPGRLFTVELRLCQDKQLSDKSMACVVVDAADPDLNAVPGVTCSAELR